MGNKTISQLTSGSSPSGSELMEIEQNGLSRKIKLKNAINISGNNNLINPFGIKSFPMHDKYRAWQGVATDGNYIYITTDRNENFELENIISVYTMDGNFVSEKLNAYTDTDPQGKFMSFGDCSVIYTPSGSRLFVAVSNANDDPSPALSRILQYSLPDLTFITENDITGQVAECIVKHNGYYWVSDTDNVKKFDFSFNLLDTYPLSPSGDNPWYQSLIWYDGDLYLNTHGPNSFGTYSPSTLDRYSFDGSDFTLVEAINQPTTGTSQGICYYNGLYYWNDRQANEIVITGSLKSGKIEPLVNRIKNEYLFKPELINGWVPADAIYDRTLKVWKDPFGVVHLEGIVKSGLIGHIICVLPEGYRPQFSRNFTIDSNQAFGRIAIVGNNSSSPPSSAGAVVIAVGDNTSVSLDGITFLSDPTV